MNLLIIKDDVELMPNSELPFYEALCNSLEKDLNHENSIAMTNHYSENNWAAKKNKYKKSIDQYISKKNYNSAAKKI